MACNASRDLLLPQLNRLNRTNESGSTYFNKILTKSNVFLQFNDKLKNNMCVFENESNQVLSLMTHPVVVSLKPLQKGLVD